MCMCACGWLFALCVTELISSIYYHRTSHCPTIINVQYVASERHTRTATNQGLLSSSSVIHKWSVKVYQVITTECNLPGSYVRNYVYSIQHIYVHLGCLRRQSLSLVFSVSMCIWGAVLLSGWSMSTITICVISVWMRTSSELCEYIMNWFVNYAIPVTELTCYSKISCIAHHILYSTQST